MPNWCECKLSITGPDKDLDRLQKGLIVSGDEVGDEDGIDFNFILPEPEGLDVRSPVDPDPDEELAARYKANIEKHGYPNWHDWRVAKWGTKWSPSQVSVHRSDDGLELYFNTAWAPPIPLVEETARQFPSLQFRLHYLERGMAFQGMLICEDGKTTEREEDNYYGP